MKKNLLITFLTFIAVSVFAQAGQPLAIGASIPLAEKEMKSTDGKEVSIKDVMQKNGVLVMFSCNTCPYVVKYQGRTASAIAAARKQVIGVIIINSNEEYRGDADSYEAMQSYGRQHGYKDVAYVVDTKSAVADAFSANRTPECFLFNASGKLVYHGAIDDNPTAADAKRAHLQLALTEIAEGKEVTVKETRSVGCMIKRLE